MQKSNLKVEIVKLSDIVPYSNNPRNNTNAIEPVKESISSFKFRVPIILDKDKVIIAGHTRYESAKQLNLESVPCIILEDISDEDAKEFRIVDNKSSEYSEWDLEKLEQELSEIAECGFESILKWMEKKSETEYYGEYGLVEDLDGLYDSMLKNNIKEKTSDSNFVKIGKYQIDISPDEEGILNKYYENYVKKNKVFYGIITELLDNGVGRYVS